MKRTGSIGSWVGPAVTMTFLPLRGRVLDKAGLSCCIMCSGSSMRPFPVSPQASSPLSGPRILMLSSFSLAMLRWVEAWCHIFTFMAGAIYTGLFVAKSMLVSRSSAIP